MATPMSIASAMLGKREGPERAALAEYLKNGGVNLDPATTAWCAAFVNSSLEQAGLKGTGSNMARSFLNYGEATDKPQKGDIAVFSRGDPNGPYGHVGFFDSLNPDGTIKILAGNQGNAVAYGDLPAESLLGYRRAPGEGLAAVTQTDGPKGQETFGLAPATAPQPQPGGLLSDPSVPQDVADYAASPEPQSFGDRLQGAFKALAGTPDAQAPRMMPMGDARQTGDTLLKAVNAPKFAQHLFQKRMG